MATVITFDSLVARRVRNGGNESDSRTLLSELLAYNSPSTLEKGLVHYGFATPSQAEKFAADTAAAQ